MKQIDIKEVIKTKSPFLANMHFLVTLIRKLIHEKSINECIRLHGDKHGVEFTKAVLDFLHVRVEVNPHPPLDPQGRYIFVANHPLGGLDGMAFIKAISDIYPELRYLVNDMLMFLENFEPIFVPINKHGRQNKADAKKLNEEYASLIIQFLMFPAGLVSRKNKGIIADLPWQKHFIKKAVESRRDIIPVYIDGKNSSHFYWISNLRKMLGIKANIEMVLLPDEMFRQKGKTIRITIGEPISYKTFEKIPEKSWPESTDYWAEWVRKKVYELTL